MNIILINHYAGSDYYGMEFRPYYMAKEWTKMGHTVTIIAASFSHLRKKNPKVEKDFEEEIIDNVRYVWVKTPSYKGNGVGRIINIATFLFKLRMKYKRIAKLYNPNAVIASSTYPLDIYPASRIANVTNAKLVFEIHDLWPLTPMEIGGYSEKNPAIVALQKAEDFAYRNSDAIISILPCADKHIKNRGFSTEKFCYVPNGVLINPNNEEAKIAEVDQIKILDKFKKEGYFLIGYTGNHSIANALDTFIDAAKLCKDIKAKFILVGSGNDKEKLMDYAKSNDISNVEFLPPVKKENINAVLERLDVAYIGLKRERLFSYGVSPNKLFDYMLAKKVIIYSIEAGNDPVSEANCGVSVPAENPQEIYLAIKNIMKLSGEERMKLGENGYQYVINNHQYSKLAKKFVEQLIKA